MSGNYHYCKLGQFIQLFYFTFKAENKPLERRLGYVQPAYFRRFDTRIVPVLPAFRFTPGEGGLVS